MSSGFQPDPTIRGCGCRQCGCGGSAEPRRPPTVARPDSSAEEAYGVDTIVIEEFGQWAVDIVVLFADGVVRKRIASHRTRGRAEIAASLIKRAAERDGRQLRFS